jgi:hypothetical protein
VRSLVAIEGPNHGIIDCSPDPANFFQLPANGGFIPTSAVCDEYGNANTQLLTTLNAGGETPGPTRYLVLRNVFQASPESGDFVFLSAQDGFFPAVPAEDSTGAPHDFSDSALLAGAGHMDFVGQGQFDKILGTSHLGILNSPAAWQAAFQFLDHLLLLDRRMEEKLNTAPFPKASPPRTLEYLGASELGPPRILFQRDAKPPIDLSEPVGATLWKLAHSPNLPSSFPTRRLSRPPRFWCQAAGASRRDRKTHAANTRGSRASA